MDKRLFDITEIATYLGVENWTLNCMIANREIPHVKIGELVKFDLGQVDAWILECSVPAKKVAEEEIKVDLGIKKKKRGNGNFSDKLHIVGPNGEDIEEPLICGKCEKQKQPGAFYRDKRTKRGRQAWCKQCMGVRSKERYEERKQAKLKKVGEKNGKEEKEKVPWVVGGNCEITNEASKVIFKDGKAFGEEGEEWLRKKKAREEKSRGY